MKNLTIQNEDRQKKKFHYAWLVMIGCCLLEVGGLGCVFDAAGVFFVPVCEDLGFGRGQLATYMTVMMLSSTLTTPFVGSVLRRYNVRVVMSVCYTLVALAVGAMSLYTEVWHWYLSGLVFGLAGSFVFLVPAPILIGNWFQKKTGMALGIVMSFSGIGAAIFSPVFTHLIGEFGWRNAYVMVAVIMIILVLPWTLFVFRFKPEEMGLKPYGYEAVTSRKTLASDEAESISASSSVPTQHAVRSVTFWAIFAFAGIAAMFSGFNAHLPGYAMSIGYSAVFAGTLLSAVMIGNVIDKLIMGRLNDLIGVKITTAIQIGIIAVGMVVFLLNEATIGLYIAAFLFGCQNSLVAVGVPLLTRLLFGQKNFPELYSYARIGTGLIGAAGPITVGTLFDTYGSYRPAFVLGLVICMALAILMTIAIKSAKGLKREQAKPAELQAATIGDGMA